MIEPWCEWHRQLRESIARESAELAAKMTLADLTRLCEESDFVKKGAPVEKIVESLVAGKPYILKNWINGYDIAVGLDEDVNGRVYLRRLW